MAVEIYRQKYNKKVKKSIELFKIVCYNRIIKITRKDLKMYIKPTKTMAKFVEKALDGLVENVALVSFNDIRRWNWNVNMGEPSKHDYNNNGQLQAIRIVYFGEDYAVDKFLDKQELDAIFQNSDKTLDGFSEAIREALEL